MYSCRIIPGDSKLHEPINLEHGKTLIIGRGPLTKVKDSRLSRNHVELTADCQTATLSIKLIGENKCQVNERVLRKGEQADLKDSQQFHLLERQYSYQVVFELNDDMVGKQSKLDQFLKRKSEQDPIASPSKKQKTGAKWEEIADGNLIVYTSEGVEPRSKIAAFDLDGTLITTKSGNVFPKNRDDWKLLSEKVPPKLRQLRDDGYKVVILTNQAGLKTDAKLTEFRDKLRDVIAKLGVPVQAFISPKRGIYRKPAPGMWTHLVNEANDGVSIDTGSSFYCGDAAGREANWSPGKKKDHSSVDRLLAHNLRLDFYTPEEYFLGQRPVAFKPVEFEPNSALDPSIPLLEPADSSLTSSSQEVIILVGFPGSGKSHFSRHHSSQSKYQVVNRDTLGTWQKCAAAVQSALAKGQSVIVDNTNLDPETRRRIVTLAKDRGLPARCFLMNCSSAHAQHNNKFRELTDSKHQPIDAKVYAILRSKYVEPTMDEGYSQIVRVNFVAQFQSEEQKKLYKLYLLEN